MKNEFSYVILAEKITSKREEFNPEMDSDELKAVCERLQLKDLDIKTMTFSAQRMNDGCTIFVEGKIVADVVQPCVVSLEDVKEQVSEEFEGFYLDESEVKSFEKAKRSRNNEDEDEFSEGFLKERKMPEAHEEPEIVTRGKIDVGELIVQSLSLGINPYPHAPGVMSKEGESIYKDEQVSPFAALKDHIHNKK